MRLRLPLHGRSHLPTGADPIPYVEASAIWGSIIRDGSDGTMAITSGAITATTTLVQHVVIQSESGVECDIVSTPSRIVIVTPGLYVIQSELDDLDSGSSDYAVGVGFGLNDTSAIWTPVAAHRRVLTAGGRYHAFAFIELDEGDFITQPVGQNSGTTKTFTYLAALTVVRYTGPVLSTLATIDGGSP